MVAFIVVVVLLGVGLVAIGLHLGRLSDTEWEAQTAEWDEQTRAMRAMHRTPGGLGRERGAS